MTVSVQPYVGASGEQLVWFAASWPGELADPRSRRAYEAAMELTDNSHVWRFQVGGTDEYAVVGMAAENKRRALEAMCVAVMEVPGWQLWEPPTGFLEALSLRRQRMMIERVVKGDFGLKRIENRPRRLDRRGRMTDEPKP